MVVPRCSHDGRLSRMSQAVYYDWKFFLRAVTGVGLMVVWVDWTLLSGFPTIVYLHKGDRHPDIG